MPSRRMLAFFREGQIVLFHFQHVELAAEINKAQHAGDDLRNVGCQRRAEHAEMERHDKQKVKADVQCAGQNQKVKRRLLSPSARMMAATILYRKMNGMPAKIQPM